MLDAVPSTAWLHAFINHSKPHLESFCSSSLVTVVWSMSLLQHRPPTDWMLSVLSALAACMGGAAAAGDVPAGSSSHASSLSGGQHSSQHATGRAEPLAPAQVTRVAWALAALDCHLPAAFAEQLLQLCLQHAQVLDGDSLAQLVWAWDRLDDSPDKQAVRQVAAAARAQLAPHAEVLSGPLPNMYSSSGGGSIRRASSSRVVLSPADVALQRPSTRVRLGQQRVVLRPGTSSSSSSASRARVVAAQQQHVVPAGSSSSALLASPGLLALQRESFAASSVVQLSTKQQLMATLQKIYLPESKPSSSSSSTSSGSSSSAGFEVSVSL